jgi:hypothetical protein
LSGDTQTHTLQQKACTGCENKNMPVSKYNPEMLNTMLEMGKQGASQKMIWSELNINKSTADAWRKKYPEFADALDLALVHSQAYWERLMLANAENKNFNTRMVEVAVRGQFQQDYRERLDVKQEVKSEITIDFNSAVNDLISTLKKAADNAS